MTYPRKHLIKTLLALLFLSTLALVTTASAQITPSADSYTNTADPTTNYGAKTLLDVDGASQVTFIQFNLASIPTGATVSQATLKLYVNTVATAGSFNVDYVSGTWLESTIDSSNAPALGAAIASNVAITTADKNQYILINITPAVQAWLSGSETNNGIALVANSTFNATFDSKENTATSHPPELDVVFAGGSGITGITTASGSGLIGGGTSGTLNLSLTTACASGQILQWNGSAWACATASGAGTVTSVAAGTGLAASPSPITTSGTLSINTAVVPQLSTANTFTSNQTMNGSTFMIGDTRVDYNGLNKGTTSPGIRFGTGNTGEGISSDRAGTINGNGIDLYTDFLPRLSVTNGGSVGIGTTSPAATLDVIDTAGVGAMNALGFSVSQSSSGNGTYGLESTGGVGVGTEGPTGGGPYHGGWGVIAYGGNAGATSAGYNANGGYGVYGQGGEGIFASNPQKQVGHDGPGGYFVGGSNTSGGDGIDGYPGSSGYAGFFVGNVWVQGTLSKNGGSFKIDHPLDPANKYLSHSFVESPDMMNIYNGNATLDAKGEAVITMPEWFSALNRDFRYQLTCIGGFAPVFIADELASNQFKIGGGRAGMKVSWQITGIRQDAWANAHRIPVEEEKEEGLKGYYINPELYGAAPEKQMEWARHPDAMKKMQEHRQQTKEKQARLTAATN